MNKKIITISIIILAIAVIAGGFWYTKNQTNPIDVIKNIQTNIEQKENGIVSKKAAKKMSDETKFGIDDSGLQYNEDGSVDVTDWKECVSGALTFLCPPNWNNIFHGITNISRGDADMKSGSVIISAGGDGISRVDGENWADSISHELSYVENTNGNCERLIDEDQFKFIKCLNINEVDVNISYIKIGQVKQKSEIYYVKETLRISCATLDTYNKNEKIIKTILENFFIGTEKFIPPNLL